MSRFFSHCPPHTTGPGLIVLALSGLVIFSGCANPLLRARDKITRRPPPRATEDDDGGIPLDGRLTENLIDRVSGREEINSRPLASKIPAFVSDDSDEGVARAQYEEGANAFRQRDFKTALASYEKAARTLPDSPLHEDAMFMVAESHFFADQYPKAFRAYEEVISKYKRTRHLDTVAARQFSIGQYWLKEHNDNPKWFWQPNLTDKKRPRADTLGRARRAFEKVRLNNPTGALADDSIMATASSYFSIGRYLDADYYYTLLRREYPNSEHQYLAHVLGIQAKIRHYQGPDYDGAPLEEALELANQTLKQFSEITPEDRQRLLETRTQIETGLAQRDFERARYFEKQGYNGAARIYYARVAENYGQTQFVAQSQQRLQQIAGDPEKPPERLSWISNVFPEPEKNPLEVITAAREGATIKR